MGKSKVLSVFVTLGAFFFIGCASHQNFVRHYERWVGHDIHHFIAVEGHPERSITLPNGNIVYIYEDTKITYAPVMSGWMFGYYHHHGVFGYGSEPVMEKCKLFIETDKKGKIVRWSSRGNSCRR